MRLRSPSRVAIALCALLVFLPVPLWIWRNRAVDAKWNDMEREIALLLAEARGRSGARPVLRGTAQPGRAWEKYDEAIRLLGGFSHMRGGGPYPPESPEWFASVLKSFAPAAGPFREGTTRADGQRYRDWEGAEAWKTLEIVHLGQLQALVLDGEGKAREAAEWLLDLLQFCGDASRNGSWQDTEEAQRCRTSVMSDLKTLLQSPALGKPECAEIARELEIVDLSFPSLRVSLVNSAMSQGCLYLDASRRRSMLQPAEKVSWRHLFSERVLISAAFFTGLDALRRIGDAEEVPWAEARNVEPRQLAVLAETDNLILGRFPPAAGSAPFLRSNREQRTSLRLLRAAAHYRATGSLASIPDPFGTTLRHLQAEGRVKIWSVGVDGIDNGGVGEWKSMETGDIVIELKPRD